MVRGEFMIRMANSAQSNAPQLHQANGSIHSPFLLKYPEKTGKIKEVQEDSLHLHSPTNCELLPAEGNKTEFGWSNA